MDIRAHNSEAWDQQVATGNVWTQPVSEQDINAARNGQWHVQLTTTRPVPAAWFGPIQGLRILCLASGGGQQGPILAAAGAQVTVFDNSPAQLEQDRKVAQACGLDLALQEGDMADLSRFDDGSFDLVFNPVSSCFIPDLAPVWQGCFRVLKSGGRLLSGHMNPAFYVFDFPVAEANGQLIPKYPLPYSDLSSLSAQEVQTMQRDNEPFEFSHTLEALLGGQMEAGFLVSGFYEDRFAPEAEDALSHWMPTLFASCAVRP